MQHGERQRRLTNLQSFFATFLSGQVDFRGGDHHRHGGDRRRGRLVFLPPTTLSDGGLSSDGGRHRGGGKRGLSAHAALLPPLAMTVNASVRPEADFALVI